MLIEVRDLIILDTNAKNGRNNGAFAVASSLKNWISVPGSGPSAMSWPRMSWILRRTVWGVMPWARLCSCWILRRRAVSSIQTCIERVTATPSPTQDEVEQLRAALEATLEKGNEAAEQEGWDLGGFGSSHGGQQWFDAGDGLDTVRALAGYIESDPDSIKRAKALLEELKEFEKVLEIAQQHNVRFRLEADY